MAQHVPDIRNLTPRDLWKASFYVGRYVTRGFRETLEISLNCIYHEAILGVPSGVQPGCVFLDSRNRLQDMAQAQSP